MSMTTLCTRNRAWSHPIVTFETGARLKFHLVSSDHILFVFTVNFISILIKPMDTYSVLKFKIDESKTLITTVTAVAFKRLRMFLYSDITLTRIEACSTTGSNDISSFPISICSFVTHWGAEPAPWVSITLIWVSLNKKLICIQGSESFFLTAQKLLLLSLQAEDGRTQLDPLPWQLETLIWWSSMEPSSSPRGLRRLAGK